MKKYIVIVFCALSAQIGFSQESSDKEIIETSFEVDGVCGMCKERIENAAMRTKGVKSANWDVETHQLKVIYKASKVSEDELHKALAAVGHDTKKLKAKDDVYEKINPCCHYRDEEVVKSHHK